MDNWLKAEAAGRVCWPILAARGVFSGADFQPFTERCVVPIYQNSANFSAHLRDGFEVARASGF